VATSNRLRPLSIGEILDAAIKVVTRHWKPLIICVVALVLPLSILQVLVTVSIDPEGLEFSPEVSPTQTPEELLADQGIALGITLVFAMITFVFVNTACFKAVCDAWLGAEPTAGRSLRYGFTRAPMVTLLAIVWTAVMLVAWIPLFIPMIWLGVMWCISLSALLFERRGPFKALGRSYSLIEGRFWASLLLLLVSSLIVGIVGSFVAFIPAGIAEVVARENTLVLAVATVVGTTLASCITYPYSAAVLTILYFDQRVRKEGFDVQMLAEGVGAKFDPDAPIPLPLMPPTYAPQPHPGWQPQPPQGWQPPPQGWQQPQQEGWQQPQQQGWSSPSGWSAPSPEDPRTAWGPPPPPPPPDERPPDASPWMTPTENPPTWSPPGQDAPAEDEEPKRDPDEPRGSGGP